MKVLFLSITLFFSVFSLSAQIENFNQSIGVPDHTPMMNKTWEAIDKMMYKVSTSGGKKTYTPHYPPVLKALENKMVDLPGYIVPLKSGRDHSTFMISVLPLAQCQFCGSNGIPPMVEVIMKKGSVRYTDDPIKLKGRLVFHATPMKGNAEIQLIDAILIK